MQCKTEEILKLTYIRPWEYKNGQYVFYQAFREFCVCLTEHLSIYNLPVSIDASKEDGSFGRLVNDDHQSPNGGTRIILVGGKPHLCLFAIDNIASGSEIRYNYGDCNWPWRALVSKCTLLYTYSNFIYTQI